MAARRKTRGRPAGQSSEDTRQKICQSAAQQFSLVGYDGASLSAVAEGAGLAPSAIYHYFSNKEELFRAVYLDELQSTWERLERFLDGDGSVVDKVTRMVERGHTPRVPAPTLLASAPSELLRHPELADLLEVRAKVQAKVFMALARGLVSEGVIAEDQTDAVAIALQNTVMGWMFETYYRRDVLDEHVMALRWLLECVAKSGNGTSPELRD